MSCACHLQIEHILKVTKSYIVKVCLASFLNKCLARQCRVSIMSRILSMSLLPGQLLFIGTRYNFHRNDNKTILSVNKKNQQGKQTKRGEKDERNDNVNHNLKFKITKRMSNGLLHNWKHVVIMEQG